MTATSPAARIDSPQPAERRIQKPERIPLRMILIVGSLGLIGPLCIDMYLPALPTIGIDLRSSASAVQLSLTATLIGLALGQVLNGPLSDRLGRRKPLFVGLALFVIASAACSWAPNVAVLIAMRFLQGFGGSAGLVIAQAIVRDRYSGAAAARFFSVLMLVGGLGPIVAPQLGALLLHLGSWRLMFLALAGAGLLLTGVTAVGLPETLNDANRSSGRLADTLATMRAVATDRGFLVNATALTFGFGVIFAYIAGSSFVLENVYGLSAQRFSLVFGLNAVGLVAASQVNGRLVHRLGCARLLTVGLVGLVVASFAFLASVLLSVGGLATVLICMFVVMTSVGFISPNATALALNDFPKSAGSASALLGLLRFSFGAAIAPLVGLGGSHDVRPLAIVMAGCGVVAISSRVLFRPTVAPVPVEADETPPPVW